MTLDMKNGTPTLYIGGANRGCRRTLLFLLLQAPSSAQRGFVLICLFLWKYHACRFVHKANPKHGSQVVKSSIWESEHVKWDNQFARCDMKRARVRDTTNVILRLRMQRYASLGLQYHAGYREHKTCMPALEACDVGWVCYLASKEYDGNHHPALLIIAL